MATPRHATVLKWAGNKSKIAKQILATLPRGERLIEPFTGSAAVFMQSDYPRYLLSDSNQDLINLYQLLKSRGPAYIKQARRLFVAENNTRERYLALREEFNHCRSDTMRRAALFLYLNRHGFNGLCRYNSKGIYNVPFGQYRTISFPEQAIEFFIHKAHHAEIKRQDFAQTMQDSTVGDVIYCDPPYLPLSATASFTAYDKEDFSLAQQEQLAELARECAARGVPVLLSNHDTPLARELYTGAELFELQVRRNISCKGDGRGKANELLALFTPDSGHYT